MTTVPKLSAGKKERAAPRPKATDRPMTAAAIPSKMHTAMLTRATMTLSQVSVQAAAGSEVIGEKEPFQATTMK